METDEDWMKFFQAALVCIQERNDPVQALAFCRQLYSSGQEFYAGLENEDTARKIYDHCLHLLNEMIQVSGMTNMYCVSVHAKLL